MDSYPGISTITTVPSPMLECTVKVPPTSWARSCIPVKPSFPSLAISPIWGDVESFTVVTHGYSHITIGEFDIDLRICCTGVPPGGDPDSGGALLLRCYQFDATVLLNVPGYPQISPIFLKPGNKLPGQYNRCPNRIVM